MLKQGLVLAGMALAATGAQAQSQGIMGDLTLGYSYNDFSAGGSSVSGDQLFLNGRLDFDLAPSIGLQGNAGLSYSDVESTETTGVSLELIPYYELANGTKLGASVGYYDISPDGGGSVSGEEYTLQALFPVGAGTVQVGAGTGDIEGTNYDLANISGSFGIAPDWSVNAAYSWAEVESTSINELSLGVEWSGVGGGLPLVIGLEASRMDIESFEVDRIGLTVSIPLGSGRGNLFRDDTDVVREFLETIGGA